MDALFRVLIDSFLQAISCPRTRRRQCRLETHDLDAQQHKADVMFGDEYLSKVFINELKIQKTKLVNFVNSIDNLVMLPRFLRILATSLERDEHPLLVNAVVVLHSLTSGIRLLSPKQVAWQ